MYGSYNGKICIATLLLWLWIAIENYELRLYSYHNGTPCQGKPSPLFSFIRLDHYGGHYSFDYQNVDNKIASVKTLAIEKPDGALEGIRIGSDRIQHCNFEKIDNKSTNATLKNKKILNQKIRNVFYFLLNILKNFSKIQYNNENEIKVNRK